MVVVSVFQRGKAGVRCRVLGSIMWGVTWLVWKVGEVMWYVTWLIWERVKITQVDTTWNRARYNMWSQRHLEKKRRIATKLTIAKRFFQGGSRMRSRRYNSLYCTNRTSLGNLFYAKRYSIYTWGDRSYWKVQEDYGRRWKWKEGHGTLWKPLENARIIHR